MTKILISSAAFVALLVAGCGSSSESEQPVAQTVVTVVKETVVEKPAAPTAEPKPAVSKPEAEPIAKPKPKPAANLIKVPNVVGENHQYAQDTMQAAGLYMLDERDATGQGRMLVWDRNWVVVEQDPPAGTMVDEDATITLSSKKEGE
ncbi:PASTA domain-containing protein [Conexibacter arvalis]|uniref:PBP1b-binding outer membrane lipoprotein LpoB n=1 Tax=Conexibacter arvalis TaxID=912552 RepID=A0A840ILV4_9ACTN|nr:PASTA domain-containing protein [Conexibacter arvalis]MBB4664964.1 PBP1b-binding outer membrane lipoprotein LpoB [Conexibacter arvalis]